MQLRESRQVQGRDCLPRYRAEELW